MATPRHICRSYYEVKEIAKTCFLLLQGVREEASFRMFFEKVKVSKRKLEIDNLELPSERKISNHFEEGEAPVEFTSTVEEHYRQNTFSAKVLL